MGDLGPAGGFLSLLETQVFPKFSLGVHSCLGLVHGLHARSGAVAPVPKLGGGGSDS